MSNMGLDDPFGHLEPQVMAKRKAGNQIGNLIPDHQKSRIDPISLCVGGMQHIVGKISTRDTTLL